MRIVNPDLITTGIQLEASNGYNLIRELRLSPSEKVAKLPIIVVSYMSQNEYILRALRLGANDYITKPFDLLNLEDHIEQLVAESRRTGENG